MVSDGGLLDSNVSPGLVGIQVAGFTGTVTASSKLAVGSPTDPFLNLTYSLGPNAFNPALGGFATPFLFVTENGFTAFPGTASLNANASSGGGEVALFSGTGTFTPPGAVPEHHLRDALHAIGSCQRAPTLLFGPASRPILITGASPAASGDATVRVAAVPDGGSTAALLGSVLVGFGMLRRRFSKV